MIIGIDISSLPYGTGVSNYTLNLVKHLLATDHQNQYKLFFSSLRLPLPSDIHQLLKNSKNCHLYHYKLPPTLLSFAWNKLHLFPIEWLIGDCDIFHTSDWTQPPVIHAKTICTIHDLTPFLFPQWLPPQIITNHSQKMYWAVRDANFFICVSHNSQKDLLKLFPTISPSATSVIYESAEDKYAEFYKFKPEHKEQLINSIKTKYHLQSFILAQGTREPRKNLDRLINAFLNFKSLHPKSLLQLAISGKFGWGKTELKKHSDIKVLGFIDENDLVQLHAAALALIYPSLYEGFGLPVVKAMAVGTPVITSNNSSLKEIGGGAALLVNPRSIKSISDAINQITKALVRKKLTQKGLVQAKNFSWSATASNTLKVYSSVSKL